MEIIPERNLLADIPYKYFKTIVLKTLRKKLKEYVEKVKKKLYENNGNIDRKLKKKI